MNIIWIFIMIISTITIIITKPSAALESFATSGNMAVALVIKMFAIYAVWLGIMELCKACGVSEYLAKILRPITKKLFPNSSEKALENISLNLSANILGLGNAATPFGISACKELNENVFSIAMFMVINATSIQLLPTTIISMRISANSLNPTSIIAPTLISSTIATIIGVLLVIIFFSKTRKNTKAVKKIDANQ